MKKILLLSAIVLALSGLSSCKSTQQVYDTSNYIFDQADALEKLVYVIYSIIPQKNDYRKNKQIRDSLMQDSAKIKDPLYFPVMEEKGCP